MRMKENLLLKILAFLLAVAAFTGAAMMAWYQTINVEAIWGGGAPADGYSISCLERQDRNQLTYLLSMYNNEERGIQLGTYNTQDKAVLESAFSADNTNLRWQVRDSGWTLRYGNTQGDIPAPAEGLYLFDYTWWEPVTFTVEMGTFDDWKAAAEGAVNVTEADNVVYHDDWQNVLQGTAFSYADEEWWTLSAAELDAVYLDTNGITDLLIVTDDQGRHVYGPTVRSCLSANEYGYQYNFGWYQAEEPDTLTETFDITMWLADGCPVADKYQQAYYTLRDWQANRGLLLALNIACVVAGVLLTAYLCVGAGHKRGADGISLHWFHRIPGDLLLAAVVLGVTLAVAYGVELLLMGYYNSGPMAVQKLIAGGMAVCVSTLVLAWLVTFAARCKARTLWKNTVIWRICRLIVRLCRWCGRLIRGAAAAVPLVWQVVLAGIGYLLVSAFLFCRFFWDYFGFGWLFLWVVLTVAVIGCLCLWALQWKRIRKGTRKIVGGRPDYQIDTQGMFPDLKSHADELNNLGHAISAAVDEQMKSERFKAELITNVSHDLKTPLTSIINYVDLLKKEDISNPTAREYIEVLDRKSQRLKKLTEDLVEASKASTGALTVNKERLDVVQLVRQATGEYEEKLTAAGLTLMTALPEGEVTICADGRHVWRVLDNLLGNCAKYALKGTRVYLDVAARNGNAVITVKNVSRQPLNIPVEQLMERFVRGDESRTTEGSGLGLSIARSLTELQGGQFSLAVDGDLFKAVVAFPILRS